MYQSVMMDAKLDSALSIDPTAKRIEFHQTAERAFQLKSNQKESARIFNLPRLW
jgi:hypothetical protein